MHTAILINLLIVVTAAVVVVYLCNKLKIPHLVGFLITGILLSEHSFHLIKNQHEIENYAEIGVILLMFTIGLEFSFTNLKKIRRYVLLGGLGQVGITIALTTILIIIIGRSFSESVFWGFVLALSSTAIVIKWLQDNIKINSDYGKIILAVLLFQDIIVVPLMLFTPILAGQGDSPYKELGMLILKLGLLGAFAIIISKYIIPKVFKEVMKLQSQEIFLLATLSIILGITLFTNELGLSLALGAFIAGLIIAETDYNKVAIQCFLPFRYLFVSFFFVSMGMLLDFNVFFNHAALIIFWFCFIMILKFLSGLFTARLLSVDLKTSLSVGLGLAQIGEFSFILAKKGLDVQIISETNYQIFLAVSILTMLAAPWILNNMETLSNKISILCQKKL